jgi:hypothetical protein
MNVAGISRATTAQMLRRVKASEPFGRPNAQNFDFQVVLLKAKSNDSPRRHEDTKIAKKNCRHGFLAFLRPLRVFVVKLCF